MEERATQESLPKIQLADINSPEIWRQYLEQANDRSSIPPDDDRYGINTCFIGAHFGLPGHLTTEKSGEIPAFRERLLLNLQGRNLGIPARNAGAVFQPDNNSTHLEYLEMRGVYFRADMAYDLLTPLTLTLNNSHFDYFFALKCAQIDLMELDRFLAYQLQESFAGNFPHFEAFLHNLFRKYNAANTAQNAAGFQISTEIQETTLDWLKRNAFMESTPRIMKQNAATNPALPDLTTYQWALVFHYSLAALGLTARVDLDTSDVARFMHVVLGKPLPKIQNSEIYKTYREASVDTFRPQLLPDLERIRPLFEQAGFSKALESIDKKIKDLQKK